MCRGRGAVEWADSRVAEDDTANAAEAVDTDVDRHDVTEGLVVLYGCGSDCQVGGQDSRGTGELRECFCSVGGVVPDFCWTTYRWRGCPHRHCTAQQPTAVHGSLSTAATSVELRESRFFSGCCRLILSISRPAIATADTFRYTLCARRGIPLHTASFLKVPCLSRLRSPCSVSARFSPLCCGSYTSDAALDWYRELRQGPDGWAGTPLHGRRAVVCMSLTVLPVWQLSAANGACLHCPVFRMV